MNLEKLCIVEARDGRFQAVETHTVVPLGHNNAAAAEQIAQLAECWDEILRDQSPLL